MSPNPSVDLGPTLTCLFRAEFFGGPEGKGPSQDGEDRQDQGGAGWADLAWAKVNRPFVAIILIR